MTQRKEPRDASGDGSPGADFETLGAILAEIIERRRRGEKPEVSEYVEKYPGLEGAIREQLQMVELLEGTDLAGKGAAEGMEPRKGSASDLLGQTISAFSEALQRVIFLKNFEGLRWPEIARQLGEPEEKLRREYARAVRELIERCSTALERGSNG